MVIYAGLDEETALAVLAGQRRGDATEDDARASLDRIYRELANDSWCTCPLPIVAVGDRACRTCGLPPQRRRPRDSRFGPGGP